MTKKTKYIILFCILGIILFSSCSPKIIGATPHRRDRHCGCENLYQPLADSTLLIQNQICCN